MDEAEIRSLELIGESSELLIIATFDAVGYHGLAAEPAAAASTTQAETVATVAALLVAAVELESPLGDDTPTVLVQFRRYLQPVFDQRIGTSDEIDLDSLVEERLPSLRAPTAEERADAAAAALTGRRAANRRVELVEVQRQIVDRLSGLEAGGTR